jgi:transcriptional regulator with PAS, ATPase and Fis domain
MVAKHEFRDDLYYRLNVVQLKLPPLRKRMDDLPVLVSNLMIRLNKKLGTSVEGISAAAMDLLRSYPWPGNIRELENLLERAINLAHMNFHDSIQPSDFPSLNSNQAVNHSIDIDESKSLAERMDDIEKEMIVKALEKTNDNKSQAAKLLGMHTSALYRKLSKYNIS